MKIPSSELFVKRIRQESWAGRNILASLSNPHLGLAVFRDTEYEIDMPQLVAAFLDLSMARFRNLGKKS